MDDRREALPGVLPDVLPDVQHRSARGVDQRASLPLKLREQPDRHAEGRQNHHVAGAERIERVAGIRQKANAERPQLLVHVGVVDDLAGEIHRLIREAVPGLIRVVHGPVDAVAEAEFAGDVNRQAAAAVREVVRLDPANEFAVVVSCKASRDLVLQRETPPENQVRQRQRPT